MTSSALMSRPKNSVSIYPSKDFWLFVHGDGLEPSLQPFYLKWPKECSDFVSDKNFCMEHLKYGVLTLSARMREVLEVDYDQVVVDTSKDCESSFVG